MGRQWGEHCAVRCVGDKLIKFTQPIESNRQVETTAPHFFMAMGDSHAEWHHKVAFTWRC